VGIAERPVGNFTTRTVRSYTTGSFPRKPSRAARRPDSPPDQLVMRPSQRSPRSLPLLAILGASLLLGGCGPSPEDLYSGQIPEEIDYNFHVKPILSDRCFACHGPDEAAREADLRLDTAEGIGRVAHGGLFRPGELLRRILSEDPDEMMPPKDSHLELSAYE